MKIKTGLVILFPGSHLKLSNTHIQLIKNSQHMKKNVEAVESFKHGLDGHYVYGKVGNSFIIYRQSPIFSSVTKKLF